MAMSYLCDFRKTQESFKIMLSSTKWHKLFLRMWDREYDELRSQRRWGQEDQEGTWEPGACVAKSLRYMGIRRYGERSKAQALTWRGLGKEAEGDGKGACGGITWKGVII